MAEKVKAATTPAKPRKPAAKKKVATPSNVTSIDAPRKESVVTREQIALLAHQLWNERGRSHGSHEQDWLHAEELLRGRAS